MIASILEHGYRALVSIILERRSIYFYIIIKYAALWVEYYY